MKISFAIVMRSMLCFLMDRAMTVRDAEKDAYTVDAARCGYERKSSSRAKSLKTYGSWRFSITIDISGFCN